MKKNAMWYAAGVLALAMISRAAVITYNAILVNETALAYNNNYVVNLNSNGIGTLSAQAFYSTSTVANATFQDGSQSTGSFTVVSYTALSSASATNNVTVTSNSGLTGASVSVPGYVFYNGIDWATQDVSSNTAISIGAALATVPYLRVSVSGSVVYATATYGSLYNSYTMLSNNAGLTVAAANFSGGQDNASFAVNGVQMRQGLNWTAGTSNSATASSIASAINAQSSLSLIHASASGSVVTATSTINGATYNYRLQTSAPASLSASGPSMVNGVDPGMKLGSTVFTSVSNNGLTLALPILYSGSPAIGGLATGTTYYSIPTIGNSFLLSKYSTSAVAGIDLVTVTSTNTQITANSYTLAPLGFTGNASFKWQVSNDNATWSDLAVSSITVTPTTAANNTLWSFGYIGTQYVRLAVVAPTTGGLALKVVLIGTN